MSLALTKWVHKVFKIIKNFKIYMGVTFMLEGKKVAIIGDRDGIPGPAIEECIKTTGAEVVMAATECFV